MDERNELQKNRGAFLFFLSSLSAFGVDVELEMDEDTRVFGCFYAATFFPAEARLSRGIPEIALKVVKEGGGEKSPSTSIMKASNIVTIKISDLDVHMRSRDLKIDANVRKKNISHLDGRELQGIDDSWLSRETTADITSTGIGNWNQFDANSSKFGIKSSYDENLYTKKLDKSSITRWQLRKAEKLARAIESSTSKNIHVQEERGQTILSDSVGWDEEDKFSGVGIIGEVPDMKLKSSSVILQNSASSECAAIDSSMDCLDPVSESDQTDLEGGQKKKEHKLNADAAEWKPPSHIGQSKAIESCRQLNQPDEIVSDYPPFSPLNIYGLQPQYLMHSQQAIDQQYSSIHSQAFYQQVVHTDMIPPGHLYAPTQNGFLNSNFVHLNNHNLKPESSFNKAAIGGGKSNLSRK